MHEQSLRPDEPLDAPSPGGARRGGDARGGRSPRVRERPRQVPARAHAELAVGGREVLLDGLVAHVERLGDLPVRASLRREPRRPAARWSSGRRAPVSCGRRGRAPAISSSVLARSASGAASQRSARSSASAERLARLDDAAAVPERDAQVGERAGVLEPGRRGRQHVHRLVEMVELVADHAERAQRDPERAGSAEPAGELHLLLGERARRRRPGRARRRTGPACERQSTPAGFGSRMASWRRPTSSRSASAAGASPCARRSRARAFRTSVPV